MSKRSASELAAKREEKEEQKKYYLVNDLSFRVDDSSLIDCYVQGIFDTREKAEERMQKLYDEYKLEYEGYGQQFECYLDIEKGSALISQGDERDCDTVRLRIEEHFIE